MQRKQCSSFVHVQSSAAAPDSTDSASCGGAALADKLAYATSNIPSVPAEVGAGEFTDLVPPGSSIPWSGPPVAVRRGIDRVPEGPWFYIEPSLDEIEAIPDLEDRAWALYNRIVNKPDHPTERELEMINPLLGGDGAAFMLLEMRLAGPTEDVTKPLLRKNRAAPTAPPPLCLFKAFDIELRKEEVGA